VAQVDLINSLDTRDDVSSGTDPESYINEYSLAYKEDTG